MPRAAEVEQEEELDDFQKRAAIAQKAVGKSAFKLPEGETRFRILKTPKDEARGSRSVYTEFFVHRNVGPKKWTQPCGVNAETEEGTCWLCEMVEKLIAKKRTTEANELERQRNWAIQIALWDKDVDGWTGPKLWSMGVGKSSKSAQWLVNNLLIKKNAVKNLDHKAGYGFTMTRTGTGYRDSVYSAPERDEDPSSVPNSIVSKLKPFADVLSKYDKEEQKKVYYGQFEEDDKVAKPTARRVIEEDEEVQSKKRRVVEDDEDTPPVRRKVVDINYGDEEDEAPAPKKRRVVEEDEDEPPVAKKRRVVEEEEEEAPRPKRRVVEVDEDEEPAPPKRKAVPIDDDEDLPRPRSARRPVDDDDNDAPAPVRRTRVDDDEAVPVRAKKRPTIDDEDDPDEDLELATKRRKAQEALEDEEAPRPKRRVVVDEEEPPRPKRRVVQVEEDVEDEEEAPPVRRAKPSR